MTDSPEVQKLKDRVTELESQLSEEREEFDWDLKTTKESSEQTIRKQEEELARLRQQLTSAGAGLSVQQSDELQMATRRALMAERKVAELQEEVKRAGRLSTTPSGPKEDVLLRQRAEAAEKERANLIREKSAMERTLGELKAALSRAEKDLEKNKGLKLQTDSLRKELQAREKEIKELRSGKEPARPSASQSSGEFNAAIEEKDRKIKELAQELNNLASVEMERDNLLGELEGARAKIKEKQASFDQLALSVQKDSMPGEPVQSKRIVELESEVNRLKQELAKLNLASGHMLEQRERETERLKADLREVTNRPPKTEDVEKQKKEIRRLQDDLAAAHKERDTLQKQLKKIQQESTMVSKSPKNVKLPKETSDIFAEKTEKFVVSKEAEKLLFEPDNKPVSLESNSYNLPWEPTQESQVAAIQAEELFPAPGPPKSKAGARQGSDAEKTDELASVRKSISTGGTDPGIPRLPLEESTPENELLPPALDTTQPNALRPSPKGEDRSAEDHSENREPRSIEVAPELPVLQTADYEETEGQFTDENEDWSEGGGRNGQAQPNSASQQAPKKSKTGWWIALVVVVLVGGIIGVALYKFPKWFGIEGVEPIVIGELFDGGGLSSSEEGQAEESKDGESEMDADLIPSEDSGSQVAEKEGATQKSDPALRKAQDHAAKLNKSKKYVLAVKFLKGWLNKRPDDPVLLLHYGRALMGMRNPKAAVGQFEKAIDLDPNLSEAYTELGNAYLKLKKKDEACKVFGEFLQKEGSSPKADVVSKQFKKLKCP